MATAVSILSASVLGQTVIKLPKNKYTPQQDVELGREAAAEVRRQYPIIQNDQISAYLKQLGDRLIAGAPPELKNPVYEFSFTPVNLKEINAFALPGGPMFVHRGMVESAAGEAEVAGVMAHELSHVLLRHGTANATKAQNPWLQIGQIAGQIGGAVVGGPIGSYMAEGSQFGLGTLLLRYSRDFEKQADLMGAQIMARAGYDPRALAHMFETIAKEAQSSGGGQPQWLSDHPNPGNRTQYIEQEADHLSIVGTADTSSFEPIKKSFASLGPAKSMSEMAKAKDTHSGGPGGSGGSGGSAGGAAGQSLQAVGTAGQPVPRPSTQYHTMNGGKVFHASVPVDWTAIPSKQSIKVVPQNGYGPINGETVFSHGVEFGLAKASSRDLREATNALLQAFAQGNPELQAAGQQATKMSDRSAIATALVNPSPLGGQEHITVSTTFLADGTMFYYLTVVPEKDEPGFQDTFRQIGASIRLTEAPK
jgi:hypothetical protein